MIKRAKRSEAVLSPVLEDGSTSSTFLKEKNESSIKGQTERPEEQSDKHVHFGDIEIHEHLVRLGGCSIPSIGAPLGISWDRQEYFSISVDEYEKFKPIPRKGEQMLFSKSHRNSILLDLGYTMGAIARESQECEKIRKNRASSSKQFHFPGHNILKMAGHVLHHRAHRKSTLSSH